MPLVIGPSLLAIFATQARHSMMTLAQSVYYLSVHIKLGQTMTRCGTTDSNDFVIGMGGCVNRSRMLLSAYA